MGVEKGIRVPSIRTIVRDGAAAAVLFSAAGCGASAPANSVNTENPVPCITAQPTPLESATPYAVDVAQLDKLEEQVIFDLSKEFNIQVVEISSNAWPNEYLFAFNPDAKETLRKTLSWLPDDFYDSPNGYYGHGRIILIIDNSQRQIEDKSWDEDRVYVYAGDILNSEHSQPPYDSDLGFYLASTLAQKKDSENGNKTINQIVRILGGEQFVKNPGSLYKALSLAELTGMHPTALIPTDAFPGIQDGKIDTSRFLGALIRFYAEGDEALFVDYVGSIVSPGVSMKDKNYSSSKVHQVYEALKELFSGRTYPSPYSEPDIPEPVKS